MAAYASVLSVMHLIEQIQRHPDPPVRLDPKQAESLSKTIGFLQRFLEDSHSRGLAREVRDLESRIADVAHAAEDVIDSHGVRKIVRASASTDLYKTLQGVIQDMEFIEEEVKRTRDKSGVEYDDHRPRRSSLLVPPLGSSSLTEKTSQIVVGFDDISIQIMDRMTRNQSKRDIIALVGMGGVGKTTLARSIYERQLTVDCFEMRSWVTISQQWSAREALVEILLCQGKHERREALDQESEEDLGIRLYQNLIGRRYLVVMDDVWSIDAWDKLKFFFPDNNNGSRIMITTRLSKLASDLAGSPLVNVDLLDEDNSWELFCKKAFVAGSCPLELEEIGRKIARKCRGLPLSIVTTGRLLAKSDMTREHLDYVAKNLSSLVNSEGEEHCLRILSLSYVHLPVHLKPCFLYMGLFPEDELITASYLIRLWVAEGFVKPISGKALEEIAENYLKDLVERNLVSVRKKGRWSIREIKYCFIHDLLRDLCIREARKENFFSVVRIDDNKRGNESNDTQRRIAINRGALNRKDYSSHIVPYSSPFVRTCIINSGDEVKCMISLQPVQHRLIKILAGVRPHTYHGIDEIVPLVNLRFLSVLDRCFKDFSFILPTHWNLQILTVRCSGFGDAPPLDIWKMSQLRHVQFTYIDLYQSDPPPPSSGERLVVLENLQTLSVVRNFEYSEEVVKRIPNIKELSIYYSDSNVGRRTPKDYCLDNLGRLQKLESLAMLLHPIESDPNWFDALTLPFSLKKLCLRGLNLDNEMMCTVIGGSLPFLQVLKLGRVSFTGDEWNPIEGQFCILKSLQLFAWHDLKHWNANSTHFPRLEHLCIDRASSLEEFPSGIGDIQTLQSIELTKLSDSVVVSAKRMQEEQEEEFGDVGFEIQVYIHEDQAERLKSLACDNFKIYG